MKSIYPYLFEPVYKDYIWGGNRLKTRFQRTGTPEICAESWEIADRPEGMSIVANGACKGQSLNQLLAQLGPDLVGAGAPHPLRFPLLVKLIDAREVLSVQVHPHDESRHLTGGEAKTEMWYVLEATAGAAIYAGMRPGVTRERFKEALSTGAIPSLLAPVPARAGRAVFVPGGKVHAIGAGCLLLEIQQNSNTTYRVYDWDRVDAQGQGRELHLEQALQVINWQRPEPEVSSPQPLPMQGRNQPYKIIHCPYFQTDGWNLQEPQPIRMHPSSFQILFVAKGKVLIGANGEVSLVEPGRTCLVPAAAANFTMSPVDGPASVVQVCQPPRQA